VLYDSNLLRLSSGFRGQIIPGVSSRSDVINTSTLGLHLDKAYSLQRIELDAYLVKQDYNTFDYLNFSALNYRAAWHWSLTPRVRGNLSTTRDTRSNSFADVANVTRRNLRRDSTTRLDVEADLGAATRLVGALTQQRQRNEQAVVDDRDATIRGVMAGMRYVYPSGSFVGYGLRVSRGQYLRSPSDFSTTRASDFDQTENELVARWILSGRTRLDGRISYLRRSHQDASERDFSTPLAELRMVWTPTAKVRLETLLARTYTVTHTDYASYTIRNRFALMPSWTIGPHTNLRLQLEQSNQIYDGALPSSTFLLDREDTTRLARLGIDWYPRESILLTVQVQTERRTSSFTGFDYRTHGASLNAQVRF
jgi:exopolysaccharide biosynthesis operon protein EpsL